MCQGDVGVLAQENCLLDLALVPVEDDAVVICGHPSSLRGWCIVLCLLSPMVGSQEHSLKGWHVQRIWHPDGVHLSVIIFQPELESSDPLMAMPNPIPSTWWSPSMSLRLPLNWSVQFGMQYETCPSTPIRYELESKRTNVRWLTWCTPWSAVAQIQCLL